MSTLTFYFFTIICSIILFNLASGAPEREMITTNSVPVYQSKILAKTEDDEEEEEEENDILYDDPIDIKKPLVIMDTSNGIRTVSIYINIFLLIGFIFSIFFV